MRQNLISKISHINQTVLDSMKANSEKQIIKRFVDTAVAVLEADYGYSFLWDKSKQRFYLIYKDKRTPFVSKTPRKTGITARAFKSRQPQFITHAGEHEKIRSDAKQYMKGVVVIPMTYKKNNYGILDICFYTAHDFTEEEKILCTYIGNSAAQAIALNRMHAGLEDLVAKRTGQLKRMYEDLERDKVKDEALLTSIGEGIVATDTEGKIIVFNPQAEEIIGQKHEDVLGKSLLAVQPLYEENGKEVDIEDRPLYHILQKRKKIRTRNYYVIRKNGDKIPVAITVTPIMLKDQLIGAIQVIHDITKEREIDKAKSELISLASHQLRTPLSAINWYTEALIKNELGPVNPKQKKYLQEINNANQKMIELVYDFLNVSRIELGTFAIQLSAFKVKDIVEGVLSELQPTLEKKRLKVVKDYDPQDSLIHADKKIIRLIFQNLLTNSVKYTPPKGKVSIKIALARRSKAKLEIEIADTGYGIPKEQHHKIFTKLFRADNIAQMQTEGTGLGLYIVKSFVDLCKGKIWFKSKLNKGTVFRLELPVETAPDSALSLNK